MLLVKVVVQPLSLLQANGEAEVLGCSREAVDDVLRASSVLGRRMQSSVDSSSVMSSSMVFVRARRRGRLNRRRGCRCRLAGLLLSQGV